MSLINTVSAFSGSSRCVILSSPSPEAGLKTKISVTCLRDIGRGMRHQRRGPTKSFSSSSALKPDPELTVSEVGS